MPNVVDVRIKALERQIDILKNAVAQPTGLFETIDAMIKTFRMANRETLQAIGIPLGAQMRGQILNLGILKRLEQEARLVRRRVKPPFLSHIGLIRR